MLNSPTMPTSTKEQTPETLSIATECVYFQNHTNLLDSYNASSMPIYQSATFKQTSATDVGDFDYSRSGNPTRSYVESHLSTLMKAHSSFVVSSGMGALDIITRLVCSGDEIIAGNDLYGGTNRLLNFLSKTMGIKVHHVDTTVRENVLTCLNEKTKLVMLESPTNPLIKIADIPGICKDVKARFAKVLVVVDNTMMSPYLLRPLELGADIVYHSGTKYLSGHHDLMAGVIGVKNAEISEKIFFIINSTGCGLPPFDCFLLMRGVKTLAVRMDRQQENAQRIAEFLEAQSFSVSYPGLLSHPQYALHASMATGPGAVLSFTTGSIEKSITIVESTRIFGISVSFGCVNSLISMPCKMSHASIPEDVRKERGFPEDLIRLCVGIEDIRDLLRDLKRALVAAGYKIK